MNLPWMPTILFSIVITASITLAGCSDGLGLVNVEGRVTLDGQPLPDAEVVFRPSDGRPSLGKTDAAGKFQLRYSAEKLGAVPGTHSVSISTRGDNTGDEEPSAQRKERIPAEYNSRTTLQVHVSPKQREPIDFNLLTKSSTAARR
ncbi:MAG: hypothetical protein KF752_10895 [Pirellulaceae bacterium]|nr:hypothetical protein [Pirellulaceae bacterium]